MSSENIKFKTRDGKQLSAVLDTPDKQKPHNYVVFAHCFTCDKNLYALRNICRALTNEGFAVLRFDFTGLGESEGEFSETNFSSNVNDLVDAGAFLAGRNQAPSILLGHSLGGAAAIFAAAEMESIKAVGVIGAPSSPVHVKNLLRRGFDEIKEKGAAEISIGGRPFMISKQFIDDLETQNMSEVLRNLRKPIIVFHSPQDKIVGIKNAEEIYKAARHPKSYISLDGANHLLTRKRDSTYVGSVIAGWVQRYVEIKEEPNIETDHQVAVSLGNTGYTTEIVAGKHLLISDEPESVGGNNDGPAPHDFLLAGLGACTAMTLRMYADRKEWDLQKVVVHLNHRKDFKEGESAEDDSPKISYITRVIDLHGDLDDEQRNRMLEIANRCPVHRTITESPVVQSMLLKSIKE